MDIIKIQNFSKTLKSELKFNYNIKKLNWKAGFYRGDIGWRIIKKR